MGSEGEEEEDVPERRGFWDGVDLRLGAIEQTNARKRGRKRDAEKHQTNQYKKSIMSSTQSKPNSIQQFNIYSTHL